MPSESLRIGVVPYLNMQPLVFGLQERLPKARVNAQSPRDMARSLESGDLDLAMLPVVSAFEHPEYRVVPCGAIASHGSVQSVLMVGECALDGNSVVLLDPESRTSNLLCRLLVRDWFRADPKFVSPEDSEYPKLSDHLTGRVLRVLIGDRALEAAPQSKVVYDFGECWNALTGLPLVCAVWVARPGADLGDAPKILAQLKEKNRNRLDEIVAASPVIRGMEHSARVRYLQSSIRYDFAAREDAGLQEFYRRAVAAELSPHGWTLNYY